MGATAARTHEGVRTAVEFLAAGAFKAHAPDERERIERDLAWLAGELDAADARWVAHDAALHGEFEAAHAAHATRALCATDAATTAALAEHDATAARVALDAAVSRITDDTARADERCCATRRPCARRLLDDQIAAESSEQRKEAHEAERWPHVRPRASSAPACSSARSRAAPRPRLTGAHVPTLRASWSLHLRCVLSGWVGGG